MIDAVLIYLFIGSTFWMVLHGLNVAVSGSLPTKIIRITLLWPLFVAAQITVLVRKRHAVPQRGAR